MNGPWLGTKSNL